MKSVILRSARFGGRLSPTASHSTTVVYGALFSRNASTTTPRLNVAVSAVPTKQAQHVESLGSASSALSVLPLSSILRSYMVMSMSSSPILLSTATRILKAIVHSTGPVLNVERNPLLGWLLKRTFYAQFCAGENKKEVSKCIADLHKIGYSGVVLEYAMEVLQDGTTKSAEAVENDIKVWKNGLLDTVDMVNDGDFIAFKWSGMGSEALRLLKQNQPPSPSMLKAMEELCEASSAKGVLLLPAAEPQNANAAVDAWTQLLAQKYNQGDAVVYNTFQCYLKASGKYLTAHLEHAEKHGYTLGVKLVRGAYLATEKRDLIWDTVEETHHAYDTLAKNCLQRTYGELMPAPTENAKFPRADVVLATHNQESVQSAQTLRNEQLKNGEVPVRLAYAQLQGMADEISCKLIENSRASASEKMPAVDVPRTFKYVPWGTTSECLHYLLRRADENKDAMSRTVDTRKAMGQELWRRIKSTLFLA